MKMGEVMKLIVSWIVEEMHGFDDRSALHRDLLSVQMRMVIDGWFALVNVYVEAATMQLFPCES